MKSKNEGIIISYLEKLEIKVTDAVNEQVEIWKNESKEFRTARENGNLYDEGRLGNMFQAMARRSVFDAVIYV